MYIYIYIHTYIPSHPGWRMIYHNVLGISHGMSTQRVARWRGGGGRDEAWVTVG